jgi:iron complex outermembrane recepter protein
MRKHLLLFLFVLFAIPGISFAQQSGEKRITGKIIDTITAEPLIGATVMVKGTTAATSAGLDGTFKLNVPAGNQTLVISFIGYITQQIPIGENSQNIGTIRLSPSTSSTKEVTIIGDVAIDRRTPIAVSTIGPEYIEEHIGNGGIPDLLLGIPGVMTSQGDGGYGDGRVSIRGFSSRSGNGNVAYTVNGIPVNDPETGTLYWSDFAGVTDVARSIQLQRGLGASKIIIPSFGGTVNVTTRTTDQQAGGYVYEGIGSDGWNKTGILISTGLTSNGWSATFQGSRTQGAYPFDGSNFLGYNYFFNLSKKLGKSQTISLNVIGANQTHGQRPEQLLYPSTAPGTSTPGYLGAPQGINWNTWFGYKDGKQYNPYNNFYSEPIISLNHEWTINDKSSLSTVLYTLQGDGGGGGIALNSDNYSVNTLPRSGNIYTPVNYDALQAANAANPDGSALAYAYASHSKTHWYGLRSTYRTLLGKYIDLSAGIDLRYYEGNHYEQVTDLWGANYVAFPYTGNPALGKTGGNINDPTGHVGINGLSDFHNIDDIESAGAFAQAEYSKDNFSAFATLSGTESADSRKDPFDYLNGDPNQTSRWVNFTTYQAKAGANYNINSEMNVFANIGYLTKPPYFGNVFLDYTNHINKSTISEKLFSYELGYDFKISSFSAKLDLFRTSYMDRAFASAFSDATTQQLYSANISGVNELHQGVELELRYRPLQQVLLGGSASIGDYHYTSNSGPVTVLNSAGAVIGTQSSVYLKGEKIGDVPQNTANAFTEISIVPQLKIGASVNYFWNYTSYVPFQNYTSPNMHPYILPNYAIWNMNAVYKFKMAGFDAELIGTVNNLLNSKIITDAEDYNGNANLAALQVYWLNARTFTTALKVKF